MPQGGALPRCIISYMLRFCGPDTVLKVACTSACWWRASSPELVRRQIIVARRLCTVVASIRAAHAWVSRLWPPDLRGCRYIALAAVARNGRALRYAASDLRTDKQVVLAAVAQNGWALQYAAEGLRADKEVVLAAVAQKGWALRCAAEDLQADKGVVLAAAIRRGRTAAR